MQVLTHSYQKNALLGLLLTLMSLSGDMASVLACEPGDSLPLPSPLSSQSRPKERRPFYMALKNNLLYDAVAVPNIAAEFSFAHYWSGIVNWAYGWWRRNPRHRYWRIYGGELELRRWLGKAAKKKPLTGHHVGIYGQWATYDFEFGGRGQMGGKPGGNIFQKANYGVGLSYGYALPVARRLNIDFTIGFGYFGGEFYEYIPADGHYVWQSTRMRRYFGPTKLEVSLMWLIGHGNENPRKGGGK